MQLYSIFLSAPAAPASAALTGGLGLAPKSVGSALSLLGGLGIVMQLAIYPPVQLKMGLLKSYRWSCGLFPIAYLATPMLVFLLDATGADGKGFAVWAGIAAVLAVQVTGRTFAFPASIALVCFLLLSLSLSLPTPADVLMLRY